MDKSRRQFLKILTTAGVAASVAPKAAEAASANKHFDGYPDGLGVLHDTTRCIGCRSCEEGCNKVNNLPKPEKPFDDMSVFEEKRRSKTGVFTVVNRYDGVGKNGEAVFRKFQCNHCLEPACANACFVKAFKKTKEGAVVYDPSVCVGCRFCLMACPWSLPAYEYDNPYTPVVVRCTLCHPRVLEGKLPGCVEACPTEALTFGKRDELLKIARERIKKHPDRYIDHIFGEKEIGGTSWLYLSGVDFNKLGLNTHVGTTPPPKLTAGALGAVPIIVGLWPVFLTGVWAMNKRKEKIVAEEKAQAVKDAINRTNKEADNKMKAAMDKAAKDKEKAIDSAVKKALKDAEKAQEEKA